MSAPGDDPNLERMAQRLEAERPVPHPAFRGELRRELLATERSGKAPPARLRARITAYAGSGAAMLLIAAVGLAGIGPFGA
jgi:hypothetical protein